MGLGDGEALPDGTDVVLAELESEPVDEELAPRDSVAVGERETERDKLRDVVGVMDEVGVLVAVAEPVGVTEGETEAVALAV